MKITKRFSAKLDEWSHRQHWLKHFGFDSLGSPYTTGLTDLNDPGSYLYALKTTIQNFALDLVRGAREPAFGEVERSENDKSATMKMQL